MPAGCSGSLPGARSIGVKQECAPFSVGTKGIYFALCFSSPRPPAENSLEALIHFWSSSVGTEAVGNLLRRGLRPRQDLLGWWPSSFVRGIGHGGPVCFCSHVREKPIEGSFDFTGKQKGGLAFFLRGVPRVGVSPPVSVLVELTYKGFVCDPGSFPRVAAWVLVEPLEIDLPLFAFSPPAACCCCCEGTWLL